MVSCLTRKQTGGEVIESEAEKSIGIASDRLFHKAWCIVGIHQP